MPFNKGEIEIDIIIVNENDTLISKNNFIEIEEAKNQFKKKKNFSKNIGLVRYFWKRNSLC